MKLRFRKSSVNLSRSGTAAQVKSTSLDQARTRKAKPKQKSVCFSCRPKTNEKQVRHFQKGFDKALKKMKKASKTEASCKSFGESLKKLFKILHDAGEPSIPASIIPSLYETAYSSDIKGWILEGLGGADALPEFDGNPLQELFVPQPEPSPLSDNPRERALQRINSVLDRMKPYTVKQSEKVVMNQQDLNVRKYMYSQFGTELKPHFQTLLSDGGGGISIIALARLAKASPLSVDRKAILASLGGPGLMPVQLEAWLMPENSEGKPKYPVINVVMKSSQSRPISQTPIMDFRAANLPESYRFPDLGGDMSFSQRKAWGLD